MCSISECENTVYCKAMCMKHYNAARWKANDSEERRAKMRDRANLRNQSLRDSGLWSDYVRQNNLKQLYGLTVEKYDEMLESQNGLCAICGEPPTDKRLHIDHDHSCCPGRKSCGSCIRGLLCGTCNTMLGKIERKEGILEAARSYLGVTV